MVNRKLAELGYKRSAKKCKEKFENVHKYYKRTKEGRAGRQDGKAYRFFSQLEALHNNAAAAAAAAAPPGHVLFRMQPPPVSAVPLLGPQQTVLDSATAGPAGTGGFAWNNSSSSSSSGPESDDEDTEDDGVEGEGRKRKRRGGSRKMMAFFEGLMQRVTVRQDEMQRRLLEAIEKREQERMIHEEAWRRQEMARFGREQELLAQERALAASRDAAVISYLQKITSGAAQTTSPPPPPVSAVALATIPISVTETLPPTPQPLPQLQPAPSKKKPAPPSAAAEEGGVGNLEPPLSSSRWPKAEVHALIDLRSRLEVRYQEAGPKGLLWEEISAGMRRLGYDRSSKRCKEKWENINKYFKKVKDGNKRRPEDAKTCPYFHQLEALYRRKHHGDAGVMAFPPPAPPPPPATETAGENSQPLPTNNNEGTLRKAEEEAVKDLMEQTQRQSLDLDEYDSENMEQDDDEDVDDEDDDEDSKMQYKIQFQQHNVGGPGGSTSTAAPAPGSFLAMVQ